MQTAEMPGMYKDGEYDLAGFAVGSVDADRLIDGSKVAACDVILGLPSSGVHSNGFSLVRKILEVRHCMMDCQASVTVLPFAEIITLSSSPTQERPLCLQSQEQDTACVDSVWSSRFCAL